MTLIHYTFFGIHGYLLKELQTIGIKSYSTFNLRNWKRLIEPGWRELGNPAWWVLLEPDSRAKDVWRYFKWFLDQLDWVFIVKCWRQNLVCRVIRVSGLWLPTNYTIYCIFRLSQAHSRFGNPCCCHLLYYSPGSLTFKLSEMTVNHLIEAFVVVYWN